LASDSNFNDNNDQGIGRPKQFNKMESIDNGRTWSYKKKIVIEQYYLVLCYALNDFGESLGSKLIIPSDIDRGRTYQVSLIGERKNDKEVVTGDIMHLQYAFNSVIYNPNTFRIKTKPIGDLCGPGLPRDTNKPNILKIEEAGDNYKFTKIVKVKFINVIKECTFNYTLSLEVNAHPYLESKEHSNLIEKEPLVIFQLTVVEPIPLRFVHNMMNITTMHVNDTSTNTSKVVTITDMKVEADKTIELDCQSEGRPRPDTFWYKDNKLVNLTDKKYKLENDSLKIVRAHSVDSGFYECHIANRYETISRSFKIDVDAVTITKTVNVLSKRQLATIIVTSIAVFILSILLSAAIVYVIIQKREHKKLKEKHQKLISFLKNDSDMDIDENGLINTDIKNVENMKFDDEKWEIDRPNFLIGNFHHISIL
jgi:hypothetical protein